VNDAVREKDARKKRVDAMPATMREAVEEARREEQEKRASPPDRSNGPNADARPLES
jgi:hypothetical protein